MRNNFSHLFSMAHLLNFVLSYYVLYCVSLMKGCSVKLLLKLVSCTKNTFKTIFRSNRLKVLWKIHYSENVYSEIFHKIHLKAPVSEYLFNKVLGCRLATLLKRNSSSVGNFFLILRSFSEQVFCRTNLKDGFCLNNN